MKTRWSYKPSFGIFTQMKTGCTNAQIYRRGPSCKPRKLRVVRLLLLLLNCQTKPAPITQNRPAGHFIRWGISEVSLPSVSCLSPFACLVCISACVTREKSSTRFFRLFFSETTSESYLQQRWFLFLQSACSLPQVRITAVSTILSKEVRAVTSTTALKRT